MPSKGVAWAWPHGNGDSCYGATLAEEVGDGDEVTVGVGLTVGDGVPDEITVDGVTVTVGVGGSPGPG